MDDQRPRWDRPLTKYSRRISAHCSTPTTSILPSSLCADELRLRRPPHDTTSPSHRGERGAAGRDRVTDVSQGLMWNPPGGRGRLTEAKRRRQGLVVCRAALPFEGL